MKISGLHPCFQAQSFENPWSLLSEGAEGAVFCSSQQSVSPAPCDPMHCIALQPPLSVGFPRQEYWSGLSSPPPGIEAASPVLQADSLPSEPGNSQEAPFSHT